MTGEWGCRPRHGLSAVTWHWSGKFAPINPALTAGQSFMSVSLLDGSQSMAGCLPGSNIVWLVGSETLSAHLVATRNSGIFAGGAA